MKPELNMLSSFPLDIKYELCAIYFNPATNSISAFIIIFFEVINFGVIHFFFE